MGEMADEMLALYGYPDDDGPPRPEDYLDMTDANLRSATAASRSAKIKSIREWPDALSPKQRYCLAAWIAKYDTMREE